MNKYTLYDTTIYIFCQEYCTINKSVLKYTIIKQKDYLRHGQERKGNRVF